MNKIVCFDTNILVWGIKQESTTGQEQNIKKAAHLISTCSENGSTVIIPSIVVAELLCGVVDSKRREQILRGMSGFRIVPFDTRAALLYAKVWTEDARKRAKPLEVTRPETKADSMIVATAMAHGATIIYSHDIGMGVFAKGHIEVRELPDLPAKQEKLL